MKHPIPLLRNAFLATLIVTVPLAIPRKSKAADPPPSGEVGIGKSQIEPAYNDLTGGFMYLLTPLGTPLVDPANQAHAVAPLYVIVYPSAVAGTIGTVNCQHQPMDNCPDHGPEIAGLAMSVNPTVYGGGVWGHDHVGTGHPNPRPAGGDFNVAWVPVAVLFKTMQAASNHITTLAQLNAAIANNQVQLIYLWSATFQCSPVSATVYNNGTPVTPAPPIP